MEKAFRRRAISYKNKSDGIIYIYYNIYYIMLKTPFKESFKGSS